jgi:hypothetical protein
MADLLSEDSLEFGTIGGGAVTVQRTVGYVGSRSLGVPEDVGPFLDLLEEVLRIESGVTERVSELILDARLKGATYAVPCQTCIFGRSPVY